MIYNNQSRITTVEDKSTAHFMSREKADNYLQGEESTLLWLDRIVLPLFLRYITPDMNVLDVACGTGRMSIGLARHGCRVTGADISENMMAHLEAKAKDENLTIPTVTANAKELPFENDSFDAVVSMWFLEHFVNWREYLAEQIRVVKKGGFVGFEFSFKEHYYMAHSLGASRISQHYRTDDESDAAVGKSFYATTTMPEMREFCGENGVSIEAIMPHSLFEHNAFLMNAATIDACRTAKNDVLPRLINDPNVIEYASFYENEMVSNMPFWATRRCIVLLKKT